jgi:hypothetical protein
LVDAVQTLEGEVRELIRRSGLDPQRDEGAVRRLVQEAVADYDERSVHGGMQVLSDPTATSKALWDSVVGYGPLQQNFDDHNVEAIWVNDLLTAGLLTSCEDRSPPTAVHGSRAARRFGHLGLPQGIV